MQRLILVRGLPGSGKTTIAKQYAAIGFKHYEADHYFVGAGGYAYDPKRIGEAHSWCLCNTIAALANGENVVVANTFTRRYEMATYEAVAAALGATVEIIVATGQYQNVHGVPPETIEAMRVRWEA